MGGAFGPLSADHPQFWARATELGHVAAWHSLARFLETLRGVGIPALPVKGIVTAYQLYADPSERPIADVDVRVLPRHVARIAKVARQQGWSVLEHSRMYANVVLEISGVAVDVEATIGPPGMCGLLVEQMHQRATAAVLGGRSALVPHVHDHALLLAVNVFKDKLVRAAPWAVEDLKRIAMAPTFCAEDLARLADQSGCSTLLWIVADWLAHAHGSVPWERVRAACGPVRRPTYARLYRWLVDVAARRPVALPLVTRIASDRPLSRINALGRAIAWQVGHPGRWS